MLCFLILVVNMLILLSEICISTGAFFHFEGEIFGGIHVSFDSNDAKVLLQSLENCCCCQFHGNSSSCCGKPIPELLSSIKGPWAVIYWQVSSWTGKFFLAVSVKYAFCFAFHGKRYFSEACPSVLGCLQDPVVWQGCNGETEPSCSLAHFRGFSAYFIFYITSSLHFSEAR